MSPELYIGLMSGTSADSIDAALVDFSTYPARLIDSYELQLSDETRQKIIQLCQSGEHEIDQLGELDVELGQLFAQATLALLDKSNTAKHLIRAIGSHGQTIRHRPQASRPFTLQIGDPNTIAQTTGITTVADFRRRDMAVGGQGAPLAPAFHQYAFRHPEKARVVVNIGGMANISYLACDTPLLGYDTGPGNTLLDAWIYKHRGLRYDNAGQWAASGKVQPALLESLLSHPFFSKPAPKSTGREDFNLSWLLEQTQNHALPAEDVQCSLVELSALTIAQSIQQHPHEKLEVFVCGGGAYNTFLLERLQLHLDNCQISTSMALGIEPEWVEAMAFAWLAKQCTERQSANVPSVTGAQSRVILGGIYPV